ncbi:MAG: hypothetical protein WDN28_33915 [Chthoniobacter sp.]
MRYARSFYYNARAAIGQGALKAAPDIDLDLWQGPVTADGDIQPFVHYDWHWLWHWGNGELGNNGIHFLDILRWGLQVEYPERVTYNGNRYWHAGQAGDTRYRRGRLRLRQGRHGVRAEQVATRAPRKSRSANASSTGKMAPWP